MRYNSGIYLVLVLLLLIETVLATYPYGCVQCNNNNLTYCQTSADIYNCYKSVDSCSGNTAVVVPLASCKYVPTQCADFNNNCNSCVTTTAVSGGCQMCVSSDAYCRPAADICRSTTDTKITTTAQCTSSYATAIACNQWTDCATCLSKNCFYIPDLVTNTVTKGCSAVNGHQAITTCSDGEVVCPLRSSGYNDMCNCLGTNQLDTTCSICYGDAAPETNYKCTSRASPDCAQSYDDCTLPALTCPPLINKFDPYGTRGNCLTNAQCTICSTNPVAYITPVTLKCVPAGSVPSSCNFTTNNANDPRILCPTKLTCGDCQGLSGCTWCDSGKIGFSDYCTATSTSCSVGDVAASSCTDTCSSQLDCTSCKATSGCSWCGDSLWGLQKCTKVCAVTSSQAPIASCANAMACSAHNTDCAGCVGASGCTYCDGVGKNDGSNPGRFCSNATNCMNINGCGTWKPCVATPIHNTSACATVNVCAKYSDCISCVGQTDVVYRCYWCDNGSGTRYCDSSCTNGNGVLVDTCAYFGATTGGLSNVGLGQTGSASTGAPGAATPTAPPPAGTPAGTPAGGTPGTTPPFTPGTPSDPASPANPSNPANPASPNNPANPANPNNPNSPANPNNPNSPANPNNPNNPAHPVAPFVPGTPSDPSNPANPASPNNPANPNNPNSPANPNNPNSPANPNNPNSPANPANPNSPNNPANPNNPNNPAFTPYTPGTPSDPASPDNPNNPANPASPNNPNNPNNPANPAHSSTGAPTNQGILGNGVGVINGFDWVLFGIIVGILVLIIIIIIIIVVIVKVKAGSETV